MKHGHNNKSHMKTQIHENSEFYISELTFFSFHVSPTSNFPRLCHLEKDADFFFPGAPFGLT